MKSQGKWGNFGEFRGKIREIWGNFEEIGRIGENGNWGNGKIGKLREWELGEMGIGEIGNWGNMGELGKMGKIGKSPENAGKAQEIWEKPPCPERESQGQLPEIQRDPRRAGLGSGWETGKDFPWKNWGSLGFLGDLGKGSRPLFPGIFLGILFFPIPASSAGGSSKGKREGGRENSNRDRDLGRGRARQRLLLPLPLPEVIPGFFPSESREKSGPNLPLDPRDGDGKSWEEWGVRGAPDPGFPLGF